MKYLKKSSKPEGYISLPGPLNFFIGTDGKCEHSVKVNGPILLQWQKEIEVEEEQQEDEEDDGEEHYDFLEPMKNPDILIKFEDQRALFDVEFTSNKQLLVESCFALQSIEVYQIEKKEQVELSEPVQTFETEAKGLSAIRLASDKIYMGFQGSMLSANLQIHVYSLEYEKLNSIELEIEDNIVNEMILCHDEQWLVCVHNGGLITIVKTEDMSFTTVQPFEETHGSIENIYGVKKIDVEFVAIFEKLVINTSKGLYTCMITAEGELQTEEAVFFKDSNVTNACLIKGDKFLCTLNDQEAGYKLVTVDVEEETTDVLIEKAELQFSFDLEKIPGTGEDVYFILHQGDGLYLIDPLTKKSYQLRQDDNLNFSTCKSVALALIDDDEPERGFWVANIDNTNPFAPEIKVFDFNNQFITELRKLSQQVIAAKEE